MHLFSSRLFTSRLFSSVACIVLSTCASAHDFWIAPSSFEPSLKERVAFDLRVGERLVGEAVPRNSERIARFVAFDASGKEQLVLGIETSAPAGYARFETQGLAVVGYRSKPVPIELEAAKFEAYLAEEGLEHVIEARKRAGRSLEPGRELYSRSAKSFVIVRAPVDAQSTASLGTAGFDRRLDFTLELVPETNPYAPSEDGVLTLLVLFAGKPAPNLLVGCRGDADPASEERVRSDEHGRVRFKPRAGGMHLIRAVHMSAAARDSGADWESVWASLTLELPQRATPKPAK